MTHRGRVALALGGATYLAAWAFGSKVLYPVALGLVAAVVLAWLWTRLANRPLELRRLLPAEHGQITVRGDNGFYAVELMMSCRKRGMRFSFSVRWAAVILMRSPCWAGLRRR